MKTVVVLFCIQLRIQFFEEEDGRVEGNQERDRPKIKWMGVIEEYMRARGIDEDMICDDEERKGRIRVVDFTSVK